MGGKWRSYQNIEGQLDSEVPLLKITERRTRCRLRWVSMHSDVRDWDNLLREELTKKWELVLENDLLRIGC